MNVPSSYSKSALPLPTPEARNHLGRYLSCESTMKPGNPPVAVSGLRSIARATYISYFALSSILAIALWRPVDYSTTTTTAL